MARAKRKPRPAPTDAQLAEQATTAHHEQLAEHPAEFGTAQPAAHESGQPQDIGPRSRAEAVGKRSGYSPAGIIDKLAGARLREHQNPYLSVIKFEEKPSDDVRQMLTDANFHWSQPNREWVRLIRYESAWQDRASAEDAFRDICKAIRHERGVTHGFGGPA